MHKDFYILTFIDLYVLLCFVLRIGSKGKKNTVNNHISPNTVSQNDEIPHTARPDDTAIPHVKIKITEIPHEKKPNTAIPLTPMSPSAVAGSDDRRHYLQLTPQSSIETLT